MNQEPLCAEVLAGLGICEGIDRYGPVSGILSLSSGELLFLVIKPMDSVLGSDEGVCYNCSFMAIVAALLSIISGSWLVEIIF